jgi:succinate dehydrogenase/fumarate reductase flavoprotein subunit
MEWKVGEHLSHDVIVIGCGAAGLRAAIEAAQGGLDVCVLSKTGRGLGTSTVMSRGHFAGERTGWTREQHRESTLRAGKGLNLIESVDGLIQDAPESLEEMVRWGLRAVPEKGQLYAMGPPPVWGREIIRCLLDRARGAGVRFRSGLTAAAVRMVEGAARVLCFAFPRGEWVTFSSRALILATGGAGALYQRHDNPQRMLGEGYALALEAGAALMDMEFFQFLPIATAEPGLPQFAIPSTIASHGRLINGRGEEILEKYAIKERPADVHARDRLSQVLMYEIRDGNEAFLDLRGVSEKEWAGDALGTAKILCDRFPARHRPLRVMPTAHFFMGGVCTDAQGRTGVPGLYAAGEAAGGLHGANRMAGNALTETLVFGARAGRAASLWAGRSPSKWGTYPGEEMMLPLSPAPGNSAVEGATALKKRLQKVFWEQGGILRKREGLLQAIEEVGRIRAEASHLPAKSTPKETQKRIELRLGSETALLILEAALRREESRGAHFREDFPSENDGCWRGHLAVSLVAGKPVWSFERAPTGVESQKR